MKLVSTLTLLHLLTSLGVTQNQEIQNDPELDRLVWKYILDKYSTSGDQLSAADLTKIAKGLGKCENNDSTKPTSTKSPESCQNLSKFPNSSIANISSLNEICPQLLYFGDNPDCCDSFEIVDPLTTGDGKKKEKPTSGEVWGYGSLCVTLISMCSLAGVSVMPFMKKEFYKHLLTALVGLAVGSLTGSAVFHLIPQAFGLNNPSDPDHQYLFIALMVCGGIWMFFMLERILKFIMEYKERKDNSWNREKLPSIISSTPENVPISLLVENGNCVKSPESVNGNGVGHNNCSSPIAGESSMIYECQEQAIKASFGHQQRPRLSSFHDHSIKFEQGKDSVIATVAYMIIFGDGLHNFIDGLSIGAAFNESILTGVSISMAVFCEELPHELGDFAVLLNAGMSIRQALTYNFLSACTCYMGMAVGILLGEIEASTYIFALAGGMFLYIALVDMVPEMNEIAEETSKISVKKGMCVLLLQNLGMFIGITSLFILAKYQDNIHF